MLKIRRVLISAWDKHGLVELVRKLRSFNVSVISTGKTASFLQRNGITVKKVSEVTKFPEILSGRVKTLHPRIFGAILVNKKHPLYLEEIRKLNIEPIDMVVVNFYPFQKMLKENLSHFEMIEYIDIGGPALLRAGAKNFRNVACISSPNQYKFIIKELEKNSGGISEETLRGLAGEVFHCTKVYDSYIYNYFKGGKVMNWDLEKIDSLRYGENPHQKASLFRLISFSSLPFKRFQGKQISFNNLLDLDTAFSLIKDFLEPAAVVVKHLSPCGMALGKNICQAYYKAYHCDPLSSFGGVIGLNRKVDRKTAQEIIKSGFRECIIAPNYSKGSIQIFSQKKNLRVIQVDFNKKVGLKDIKKTSFGYLVQDSDTVSYDKNELKVVTKKKPTPRQLKDLLFAWQVSKFVKSNSAVIVKNLVTIGIGGGQPSRVGAVDIALGKVLKSIRGAVIASDGFFPKEDAIILIKKSGIKAIIQPGGSIKDTTIINLCDKYHLSMVFTSIRHFRH